MHGAAESDQALSQNEHIFLQAMCFKTYTLSVLEKAKICQMVGLMEEKNWVPPLAENISLQDLTVLPTEFFRRGKTHIPSVN